MNDSTDAKEKTSRRRFAKSVATALVAAPVVSSLRYRAQPPDTIKLFPHAAVTPLPYPTESGNPPVIIDGGSLGISSPATLEKVDDTETSPKKYDYKYRERNRTNELSLGPITYIRINDDYGDLLWEQHLGTGETLKVYLWIQKVKDHGEHGDEDDDTDTADYDPINDPDKPEIIIQGGALEIRSDKKMPKVGKLLKRKIRNPKRYERHDWDNRSFRIAQVKLFVSSSASALYTSPPEIADRGFRITLIFPTYR
jgi:hypothetical protein